MDAHIFSLLCDPETHEALEFQPDALVNVRSAKRYPIRDGIPDFLDKVSDQNKRYPALYDRIAVFYDLSEKVYR